jgi:hypothetical protein
LIPTFDAAITEAEWKEKVESEKAEKEAAERAEEEAKAAAAEAAEMERLEQERAAEAAARQAELAKVRWLSRLMHKGSRILYLRLLLAHEDCSYYWVCSHESHRNLPPWRRLSSRW